MDRPSWVLLVDQFGNLHAPFAQARTFLSEYGFGETKVAIHGDDGRIVVVKAKGVRGAHPCRGKRCGDR